MSAPSPTSPTPQRSRWRITRPGWIAIAVAALVGVVLSLVLLRDVREDDAFYKASKAPTAAGQTDGEFEALPAPIAGSDAVQGPGTAASGQAPADAGTADAPVIDVPPAPPPGATAPGRPSVSSLDPRITMPPRPLQQEQPTYPGDAYRRGESGTVVLRVTVGQDGHPYGIAIARSSRSRSLDRAAISAARRWRFEPATRDGMAVSDTVEIPVVFTLENRR